MIAKIKLALSQHSFLPHGGERVLFELWPKKRMCNKIMLDIIDWDFPMPLSHTYLACKHRM